MHIVRNGSFQIERVIGSPMKNNALLDYRTPRYTETDLGRLVLLF